MKKRNPAIEKTLSNKSEIFAAAIANTKMPGFHFLKNHPILEEQIGLGPDKVIVDRMDWEKIITFFERHPKYIRDLGK